MGCNVWNILPLPTQTRMHMLPEHVAGSPSRRITEWTGIDRLSQHTSPYHKTQLNRIYHYVAAGWLQQ